MKTLIVTAEKLNKRRVVPSSFPDRDNIVGTVRKDFEFEGEEVMNVPNPSLGTWYKDRDNYFYWSGGLKIVEKMIHENLITAHPTDNTLLDVFAITPVIKRKIIQVLNAFETGSATGNYSALVTYQDYTDPATGTKINQVTYGRSQTTEFGNLKSLIQDYTERNGQYSNGLKPYLSRIGKKPCLATDKKFCKLLRDSGKNDQLMRDCQDELFESKYYQPAYQWFTENGFKFPLSLLVIYDSKIHSGGILSFIRNRFPTVVPVRGGDEKKWIEEYVRARHEWLNSDQLLMKTTYRTECLKRQIESGNWDLSKEINANGVKI